MSATLRVEDFQSNTRLFPAKLSKKPNVIKVAARQYPVTTYFSKVSKADYCEAAFRKVRKIHNELPPGGILVFLTGKKEINYLCQRLKIELAKQKKHTPKREDSDGDSEEAGDVADAEDGEQRAEKP